LPYGVASMKKNTKRVSAYRIKSNKKAVRHRRYPTTIEALLESEKIGVKILAEIRKRLYFSKASIQLIRNDNRFLLARLGGNVRAKPNPYLLRPISGDPLISEIVRNKKQIILPDVSASADWQPTKETADVRSWIGFPLLRNDTVVGIVTLDHTSSGQYTSALSETLSEFSALYSGAIARAREIYDVQRLIRDVKFIWEIENLSSRFGNSQDYLHEICKKIAKHLDCSHCTIFELGLLKGKARLRPRYTYGKKTPDLGRSFGPEEGIVGWVFSNAKAQIIHDASKDKRFLPATKRPNQSSSPPRSMLVCPIQIPTQIIGVISADKDEFGGFIESDLYLIETLAMQIGSALFSIQNYAGIGLVEKINAQILLAEDKEKIMQMVVNNAMELLQASTGIIYLLNEDKKTVTGKYHAPKEIKHPDPRLDDPNGITNTVIRTKKPVYIPDIRTHPYVNEELKGICFTMAAVPIIVEGDVLGVFFLDDVDMRVYTESEKTLLQTLANQSAIAIRNAKMREDLQKEVEEHKVLESHLDNLILKTRELEKTLSEVGEGIIRLLGKGVTPTINLYSQAKNEFYKEAYGYGRLANSLRVPPRSNGIGKYVVKTKRPIYIRDRKRPPPGCPKIRKDKAYKMIVSMAAIPLLREDEIIGVLFINSENPIKFSDKEKSSLLSYANYARAAIDTSRYLRSIRIQSAELQAADVGFIAAGITHDINECLNHMSYILKQNDKKQNERKRKIDVSTLKNHISQMRQFIRDIMDEKIKPNYTENINLSQAIKGITATFRGGAVPKNISLECSIKPNIRATMNIYILNLIVEKH
jgi:GAF domain-containing protein